MVNMKYWWNQNEYLKLIKTFKLDPQTKETNQDQHIFKINTEILIFNL